MKTTLTTLALTAMFALPALAESHGGAGDAAAGEKVFNQCQTCHVVANEAGEVLAGKKSKTGPNLYGVIGRTAGTYPEFAYGDSIVAAGAAGLVWDEAKIVEYLADPAAFLKTTLDDKGAKSKMAFKLKKPEDAANVVAFLASLAPAPAAAPAADAAAAPAP
jgi:cytochrome c